MSFKFHAPPTITNFPNGQYIAGLNPLVPYTPEMFEMLCKEYDKQVQEHQELEQSMTTQEIEVVSNSNPNKKYIVTVYADGQMSCDCKGFSFRKTCSHVEKIKKDQNERTN